MNKIRIKACIALSTITLAVCYASLVIMEVYSKRSALGCVAPFFIISWHIVALAPAAIHSAFARLRRKRYERKALLQPKNLPARRRDRNELVDTAASPAPE